MEDYNKGKIIYDRNYVELKSDSGKLLTEEELFGCDLYRVWQYYIEKKSLSKYGEFECTFDGEIYFCHLLKHENGVYTFDYRRFD